MDIESYESDKGYWKSISIGDLNNDNNDEFIIGNISPNTYFNAYKPNIYYSYDINTPNSILFKYYKYNNNFLLPRNPKDIIDSNYNDLQNNIVNIEEKKAQ